MYDADEYLNRINEQARESLERVGESLRGLEDVTGDGEAEDGLVKVRLGPGGEGARGLHRSQGDAEVVGGAR